MRPPLVHLIPRKGRRAMKAARAREGALKAERRMGEVLRGKGLTEVKKSVAPPLLETIEKGS